MRGARTIVALALAAQLVPDAARAEPASKPAAPAPAPAPAGHGSAAAWLLVGGTIALATIGGVLAFSATSSEQDVKDLYVGATGQPPAFQGATRQRYDDLVAEGQRYEHLSWIAFGAAAVCAGVSAALFVRGRAHHERLGLVPVVAPHLVGLGATARF